ncbi:ankyrin [Thozetella sp. PMI_491]|nr:ankyrin [Thozetella sp. PMI_491]
MAETTLYDHIEAGDLASVQAALSSGAPVNAHSKWGTTPLAHAIISLQGKIARHLLEHGASPELGFKREWQVEQPSFGLKLPDAASPMHLAAIAGSAELVQLLADHGADVNDPSGLDDDSQLIPLHLATGPAVKKLVELGGDVSRKNNYAWTPLVYAISRGDILAVRILAESGAGIDFERITRYKIRRSSPGAGEKDSEQLVTGTSSPLLVSTGHGRVNPGTAEIVSILAANGADVNRRYFTKFSADGEDISFTALSLIFASRAPKPTIRSPHAVGDIYGERELATITALVSAGADVNNPPILGYLLEGQLPFADFEHREKVLELLVSKGAKISSGDSPLDLLSNALVQNPDDSQAQEQLQRLAVILERA